MVDSIVQLIDRSLGFFGLAILVITKPVVQVLSNPFPWLRNLSENWQIAIFSAFVLIVCTFLPLYLNRKWSRDRKTKVDHEHYSENKPTQPINQFKTDIHMDPRNSNK